MSKVSNPKTILICGSRTWTDVDPIEKVLNQYSQNTIVLTGGCSGADSIACRLAQEKNMITKVYPALWNKYGKSAGPIRNQQMLDEGKPDIVYAFTYDLENSRGTRDMVLRARSPKPEKRKYLLFSIISSFRFLIFFIFILVILILLILLLIYAYIRIC